MQHDDSSAVFGPVASRRLGLSLGVDLLIPKTCNLDCRYCEVGPGRCFVTERGRFRDPEEVISQVARRLREMPAPPDYLTITGSGEPTLHQDLGLVLERLRILSPARLAVITNSTLLGDPAVQDELRPAQVVMPSLDAVSEEVFQAVNRPAPGLKAARILEGLISFRQKYPGSIWLEILLVEGVNDSEREIDLLVQAAQSISPDMVQLNTVVRPPAYGPTKALSRARMQAIAAKFGLPVQISAPSQARATPSDLPLLDLVLESTSRRPGTLADLSMSLGVNPQELKQMLDDWQAQGKVQQELFEGRVYYRGLK